MRAPLRRSLVLLSITLPLALGGCATLSELAALRSVEFAFDRVGEVRVAGVAIDDHTRYSDLRVGDLARLATAVANKDVPLELIAHVLATNPGQNRAAARLVDMGWTLFIEDRRTLDGTLGSSFTIAPGASADVPVSVHLNLMELAGGGARDVFDLALAIAGAGGAPKELRLELRPTIDTALGPIRYPAPVVVRRVVG